MPKPGVEYLNPNYITHRERLNNETITRLKVFHPNLPTPAVVLTYDKDTVNVVHVSSYQELYVEFEPPVVRVVHMKPDGSVIEVVRLYFITTNKEDDNA